MSQQLQQLSTHPVLKQVIQDSMGGILYNVDNIGKYDSEEVLEIWNNLTPAEQESCDGIIQGAIAFLKEK